jgi:hypothetical protein
MLSSDFAQQLRYYKRYRMECALADSVPPALPAGYAVLPWQDTLLESHSAMLEHCFRNEIDAQVFPSLGCLEGCRLLMAEIRRKSGFLPEATLLLVGPEGSCGTVQGVAERGRVGAIQNIGIIPGHRGRGLGRALLLHALAGFRRAGMTQALLEVTARNEGAIRLYQSVGFRKRKTLYKAVDPSAAALAALV